MMEIESSGTLSRAAPGTRRAALTFPCVIALASGVLLATFCAGSSKDADDQLIELHRSDDGGHTWRLQQRLDFGDAIGGARGTMRVCYLTELDPQHLIAAAMWI